MNEKKIKHKFDFVFLVKNTITMKEIDAIIKDIRSSLKQVEHVDFLGLKKTAYTIKGENEAYYFSIIHYTHQEDFGKLLLKLKENANVLKMINCRLDS